MKHVAWGLVVALAVLHQDFWLWGDRRLLFGWLPVGLGYHVAYSLAAGAVWALVCRFAWPERIEAWASRAERGPRSET